MLSDTKLGVERSIEPNTKLYTKLKRVSNSPQISMILDFHRKISLPIRSENSFLALGAEMNSAYSYSKNGRAFLSENFGDTSIIENLDRYKSAIKNLRKNLRFDSVVSDLHPSYNITSLANELEESGIPSIKVQHHAAHAYSVAEENGIDDFSAIVCDGLGYGADNTLWGGEVFLNDKRIGHLEPQIQIGGDAATLNPTRMLYSVLKTAKLDPRKYVNNVSDEEMNFYDKQWETRFNSVITTSCGRILDSAAELLGLCKSGILPPVRLEEVATNPLRFDPVIKNNVLMTSPLFTFLVENLDQDKGRLAATVLNYVSEGLFYIAKKSHDTILFSGGCAYNKQMGANLISKGVLVNRTVPCGDSGIAYGQLAYARNYNS